MKGKIMAKIEVTGYVKRMKVTQNGSVYFQVAERNRKKSPSGEWVNDGSTYYDVFAPDTAVPPTALEDTLVKVSGYFKVKDDQYVNRAGEEVKTKKLVINADLVATVDLKPGGEAALTSMGAVPVIDSDAPF